MAGTWLLLFGLLALGRCQLDRQLVYPDQYKQMKIAASNSPYAYTNDGRVPNSNGQPIQYDQQFNSAAPVVNPLPDLSQASYYPPTGITTPIPTRQPSPLDNWSIHVSNTIARGVTKFALDLNRAIHNNKVSSGRDPNENVIFSPLSISVALAMVLLGSAGRTFNEVARVLGLDNDVDISRNSEAVHQIFGLLLNTVDHRVEGGKPYVSSASGVFVQEGFPIRPAFREISQKAYKSEVINLDFITRSQEAMDVINNWAKLQTMGKISNLLSQPPSGQTNMILASALYFNGEWNQHFLDNATKKKSFFVEPNESVEVDMMYNGGTFPFYEDRSLGVKILKLPYKGMEMSMYVLQPRVEGAAALRDFSGQLTPEIIDYLINNLKNQTCVIGMPRMKLSSTLNLKKELRNMGVRSLFENADFSVLSEGYGVPQQVAGAAARPYANPQEARPLEALPQTVRPLADPQPPGLLSYPQAGRPHVAQTRAPNASPSPIPHVLPQEWQQPLYQQQASSQPLPQTILQALPQDVSRALPVTSPQSLSNVLSQALPQPLPLLGGQSNNNNNNNDNNNDFLIFSRFNEATNNDAATAARKNLFRARRDTVDERDDDASQLTYVPEENYDDLRRGDAADPIARYVSLEENKYRFRDADGEKRAASRERRQLPSRAVDQNLLDFIQSQNLPYFGLDELRNSGRLTNPGLNAGEVLHKVEIDVTERGTEAAAVTAVFLERDGNQKRLVANRPFIFFIRHDPTKLTLFWGTINKPTPHYAAVR